jgi:RNA polymerase sigma-70 factor (ECF subfamily)
MSPLSTTSHLSIDTLLSHASGLRALARGLLGDEDAAEDVLQETWIAALERPPTGEPGGWLRSVTRHLALKRRRGETRRSSRERSVSRAEALESTDDLVAQRETLQRVVTAVSELDEPYSQVVLMRYFRDLRPRAIAEQLDLSVATVDSRLHRARAKLRDRLDATAGGERVRWAPALVAATGWSVRDLAHTGGEGAAGSGGSLAPVGRGGMAMELKILFIGVTSIALTWGGARLVSTSQDESATPSASEGELARAGVPALVQGVGESATTSPADDSDDDERAVVETRAPAPLAPSRPAAGFSYLLEGRVVGTDDLPVAGATVSFVPPGHPVGDMFTSDMDGRFALTFEAHTPRMEGLLWVDHQFGGHTAAPARHLPLEHGTTAVRVVLAPGDATWFGLDSSEAAGVGLSSGAFFEAHNGTDTTRFQWPTPLAYVEESVIEMVDASMDVAVLARLEELGYMEKPALLGRGESGETPPLEQVHVSGTVFDASGAPAALAPVVLRFAPSGQLHRTLFTDDEGAYSASLSAGEYEFGAGGGRYGLATRTWSFDEADLGSEHVWSPVLDRGLELHGTLTLADGQLADGWVVELERRDGNGVHFDATVTSEGRFALPNVAGGGRLHVVAPGAELASWVVENAQPGVEPLTLAIPASAAPGFLQVSVVTADLPDKRTAEVWVRQVASGRITWLLWDDAHDAHGQSLPAGDYRVVVGGAEHGYVDLGTATVIGGEEVALEATLPARGNLNWTPLETEHQWTLYRRGPTVSSLFGTFGLANPPEAPLPAGDYELFAHGEDFSAPSMRFTIAPGRVTELELDPSVRHELSVFAATEPADAEGAALALTITDAATGAVVHTGPLTAEGTRLHLLPGTYRVVARAGNGWELTGEAELTSSSAVELR